MSSRYDVTRFYRTQTLFSRPRFIKVIFCPVSTQISQDIFIRLSSAIYRSTPLSAANFWAKNGNSRICTLKWPLMLYRDSEKKRIMSWYTKKCVPLTTLPLTTISRIRSENVACLDKKAAMLFLAISLAYCNLIETFHDPLQWEIWALFRN